MIVIHLYCLFALKMEKKINIQARVHPHHAKMMRVIAQELTGSEKNLYEALTHICNFFIKEGMPTDVNITLPESKRLFYEKYGEGFGETSTPAKAEKQTLTAGEQAMKESIESEIMQVYSRDLNAFGWEKDTMITSKTCFLKKVFNPLFDRFIKGQERMEQRYVDVPCNILMASHYKAITKMVTEHVKTGRRIHTATPVTAGYENQYPFETKGREFDVWRMWDANTENYIFFRFEAIDIMDDDGNPDVLVEYLPVDPNGFDLDDYKEYGIAEYAPFWLTESQYTSEYYRQVFLKARDEEATELIKVPKKQFPGILPVITMTSGKPFMYFMDDSGEDLYKTPEENLSYRINKN